MEDKKELNIGLLLFEKIPEYKFLFDAKEDKDFFDIGSHLFMNEFATHLATEIKKNVDSDFVIKSINFINELSKNKSDKVLNLLKVGILEILYTSGIETRNRVFNLLNDKNKEFFKYFSKFYK